MQSDKFRHGIEPDYQQRFEAILATNKDYIRFKLPEWLENYNREVWSVKIDEIKTTIKLDSSPGVPLSMIGNTNGDVLNELGDYFNEIVLNRIEALLSTDLADLYKMSAKERVDRNLVDPVRCFVKSEPHKISKIMEGRVRLIASVSLIDKVIEMLLHNTLHKLEIKNWRNIPSKPGIGFSAEMNTDTYNYVMEKHKLTPMAYADVSGWDWSVKKYMIQDCAVGETLLCENPSQVWKHLVMAEACKESETIYQFSDGVMVQNDYTGVVNSGKYKTSRGNSWMRVYLAHLIGAEHVAAAGDDSVESFVAGARSKYDALGFNIKDYQQVETGFEFCSRWYEKTHSFPLNLAKTYMNLLHANPETDEQFHMALLQFTDYASTHPEYPAYMQLLEEIHFMELMGRRRPKENIQNAETATKENSNSTDFEQAETCQDDNCHCSESKVV